MPITPLGITTTYSVEQAKSRLHAMGISDKGIPSSFRYAQLIELNYICHLCAVARGWWHEKDGVTPKALNFGERIALVHSELSEGLEGYRKSLMSDHLIGISMFSEEMADTYIRLGDMLHAMGEMGELGIDDIILHKLEYNMIRHDHSIEHRSGEGGKKF